MKGLSVALYTTESCKWLITWLKLVFQHVTFYVFTALSFVLFLNMHAPFGISV